MITEITEDYVSFETAKLLKEKEFDEATIGYYPIVGKAKETFHKGAAYRWNYFSDRGIAAPTLQMATKWLREDYNMHIEVRYFPMPDIYRYVIIHSPATFENIDSHPQYFNTYEEACEEAIKYCLENLIQI